MTGEERERKMKKTGERRRRRGGKEGDKGCGEQTGREKVR